MCANDFYPGSSYSYLKFQQDGISYTMIITVATVWGKSDQETGKPLHVHRVEMLAFFQEDGKLCLLNKIETQCNVPKLSHSPFKECTVANVPAKVNDHCLYCRWRWEDDPQLLSVVCTLDKLFSEVETSFIDHFDVNPKFNIGEPEGHDVRLCYTHIEEVETVHICAQPQSVTFNSLYGYSGKSFELMDPYRGSKRVFFRDWNLSKAFPNTTNDFYFFEILAETTCLWENRLRAEWVFFVHASDVFAFPHHYNQTLQRTMKAVDPNIVVWAKVPIILPGTENPPIVSGNILQRFNLLQRDRFDENELTFRKRTPIGNPRRIENSCVHEMKMFAKYYFGQYWKYVFEVPQASLVLNLTSVHVMGILREKYNARDGIKDPWYTELATRLEETLLRLHARRQMY